MKTIKNIIYVLFCLLLAVTGSLLASIATILDILGFVYAGECIIKLVDNIMTMFVYIRKHHKW